MDVPLIRRRLRQQFPPATEAEFRADFFRKSLRPVRLLYVIATLLFLLFIPIDYQLLPSETFVAITAIRLTSALILIGLLAFTFSPQFERWWQLAVSATCILFGLSVALMTAASPPESAFSYATGPAFVLFLMVTFTIIRLRFAIATATAVVLIAIYNASVIWTDAVPAEIIALNDMMLLSAFALGMAAAYLLERYIRRDFIHARDIERAYKQLEATQAQLIQQAKLASLGALTAGIAHEIKNPLNFVNNFAELSDELIQEIEEEHAENPNLRVEDIEDILLDLKTNVQKINVHGRRADGIVRSMLEHSRISTGERRLTDLNALLDDSLKLAYNGLRARRSDFECTIVRAYDDAVGDLMIVPQEIGRVFINLLNNSFYAVHEKARSYEGNGAYEPTVSVSTHRVDGHAKIRISDNGPGMPPAVLEKIFEPFFTTKPPGEGTGLGLSLSHDIVVQAYGGKLSVESEENRGTSATVVLPTSAGDAVPPPSEGFALSGSTASDEPISMTTPVRTGPNDRQADAVRLNASPPLLQLYDERERK